SNADAAGAPPVAIVDEEFARQFWPGESPVGRKISPFGPPKDENSWTTVIGVVRHVRNAGARTEGEGQLYLPQLQKGELTLSFIADSSAPSAPLVAAIRSAVRDLDRDQP